MRRRTPGMVLGTVVLALSGLLTVSAQAQPDHWPGPVNPARDAFTTKPGYQPQGTLASYQRAPLGFQPVFTENVSRHGARTLFSYANDPFRGAEVAPMAANIQWDLFSDGHTYLVRMLYDEKQARFRPSCAPVRPGSYFYRLDDLERCYAADLPART